MMKMSLAARATAWVCCLALFAGSLPTQAALAETKSSDAKVIVHGRFWSTTCSVDLEEHGAMETFMVTARRYARCQGLWYAWYPRTRSFVIANEDPWPLLGHRSRQFRMVTFTLGSSLAVVELAHEPLQFGYNLSGIDSPKVTAGTPTKKLHFDLNHIDAIPYERRGDLLNMAPLRFLNDVLDMRTDWSGRENAVHVYPRQTSVAPLWDQHTVGRHAHLVGSYGQLDHPDAPWRMLPSTLWFMAGVTSQVSELSAAARAEGRHHSFNWGDQTLTIFDEETWKPAVQVRYGRHREDTVMTVWYHNHNQAMDRLKELQRQEQMATLGVVGSGAAGTLAPLILGALQLSAAFPPVGIAASLVLIGSAVIQHVTALDIIEIEDCMRRAQYHAEQEGRSFTMALEFGAGSVTCRTRYLEYPDEW
jgi:hypothetical protein